MILGVERYSIVFSRDLSNRVRNSITRRTTSSKGVASIVLPDLKVLEDLSRKVMLALQDKKNIAPSKYGTTIGREGASQDRALQW